MIGTIKRVAGHASWLALLGAALLLSACETTGSGASQEESSDKPEREIVTISTEKKAQLDEWLRAIHAQNVEMIADHLELRISQEIVNQLTTTESKQMHSMQREEKPTETIRRYSNSRGGMNHPLEFRIGKARFLILGTATLRLVRSKEAVLELQLKGRVQGKLGENDFEQPALRFADGRWSAGS
jgi:hypothetical protein